MQLAKCREERETFDDKIKEGQKDVEVQFFHYFYFGSYLLLIIESIRKST